MKYMRPKITVIMPSLNVVQYIQECLESVAAQTLKEIEILCVDAGSTDGTFEILKDYERKDNRIRVIRSSIKSYGVQVNIGLREAKADYISIIETDDFVDSHMLEELLHQAEQYDLDFIKGDYQSVIQQSDGQYQYTTVPMFSLEAETILYYQVIHPQDYPFLHMRGLNIWRGIYKTSFLRKHKITLNETAGAAFQDTGFHHLTLLYAAKVMYVKEPYYKYRQDRLESSYRNPNTLKYTYDEYKYLFDILGDADLADAEELKYIYIKMALEYVKHYDKSIRERNYDHDGILTLSEYITWLQNKILHAAEKKMICIEDFSIDNWMKLQFMIQYPVSYIDYLKIYDLSLIQQKEAFCNQFQGEEVVIFGCGFYGETALREFQSRHISVAALCDNNAKKWGQFIDGVMIQSPAECVKLYPHANYVIAVKRYVNEIKEQLLCLKVQNRKIFDYASAYRR